MRSVFGMLRNRRSVLGMQKDNTPLFTTSALFLIFKCLLSTRQIK